MNKVEFKPIDKRVDTSLMDKNGNTIFDGDYVSLAGNITADDSLGLLPNGWSFDEEDVYQVRYDESISDWSLDLGVAPDSPYNIKYMNHAVGLLHDSECVLKKQETK